MARIRYNGLTATLGADLLTADTTITFAAALSSAAGAVPTISGSDYFPLAVLDADGGVLEIIHLTAYTSGATTGTVTRAQESTTAADHAAGLTVVHGITVADATEFASAAPAPVACQAWRSTAQSIANATNVAVSLDSETFDTHGFHENVTNPTRLTIPSGEDGTYFLSGTVRYVSHSTGVRVAAIRLNGTTYLSNTPINNAGASACGVLTQAYAQLVAGDYIELIAYQNSGGALNTEVSGTNVYTWLAATKL